MLLSMLLCLLLQTLQHGTASSIDCEKLVEKLNHGKDSANKIGENWAICGPVFLEKALSDGVKTFFAALETDSLASKDLIVQYIANADEFSSSITVDQLKILITNGATVSSKFFANVQNIKNFRWSLPGGPSLPDNILEYYDGPMYDTFWITENQFQLFGSKLNKDFLCTTLGNRQIKSSLLASVSLKCLRGLIRSGNSLLLGWYSVRPEMVEEWSNHLEEDFEYVKPSDYEDFPTSVWQKILGSSKLLELMPRDDCGLRGHRILSVSLSEIGHARFAEIARQRAYVAKVFLELPQSKLPDDIFASCGREEMKVFEAMLKNITVWEKPEIIKSISSAVNDDQHYCNGMAIDTYRTTLWLRNHCSDKCRSFISVPDGHDKEEFPELSDNGPIWELHVARIKKNEFTDVDNTIPLIKLRKEFCALMAERISSEELGRLDSRVIEAIDDKCAFALKSLITKAVAAKLGPSAFRLFAADDFKLKLADILPEQATHLSEGVPMGVSAFTNIAPADLLNCSDDTFRVLTDSQIDAMPKAPEYRNRIEFRRQAVLLLDSVLPDSPTTSFKMCHNFKSQQVGDFDYKECLNVLSRIIPGISNRNWRSLRPYLFTNANLQSLLYELPSKKVLLQVIARPFFREPSDFIVKHNGQKYDLVQSLNTIRESSESLANPMSKLCHLATLGDGPLRAWLGELLDIMKTNMISDISDVDASVQKFNFPIKGDDGFPAGFLAGKAMQQGLKLPFALDPKFYGLILNASDGEIERYFNETYTAELKTFRNESLYLRVMSDNFKPTPEQVEQIKKDQSMTLEEKKKAIERARNKAWFDYNKEEGDFGWAPLNELTFNGFEHTSNYKNYEIPRGELGFAEWDAKSTAVYSEFEYENMEELFEKFRDKCLQEFKIFATSFRSGLGHFLMMPELPVANKQPFSKMLASEINGSPMAAEYLFSKIDVEAGEDIDSWYGPVDRTTFFKAFFECLTPKQLSKLVAVWTGAASTNLNISKPKIKFYKPTENHPKQNSRDSIERSIAVSGTVVIHSGDEHESFLRQFSAKLCNAMSVDKGVVDPFANGQEDVEFYPSMGSFACTLTLSLPIQHSRMMVEALIELLNDDPSNLYDP